MNTDSKYLLYKPDDWNGDACLLLSRAEAYDFWERNQDWQVIEMEVSATGAGRFWEITDTFADEYVAECREARALRRHERSFAPERRTHL